MKTCKMCPNEIPPRHVYCSDDCRRAARRAYGRAYYRDNPDYARMKREDSRRWHAAHPTYAREYKRRQKAAAFARKLDALTAQGAQP